MVHKIFPTPTSGADPNFWYGVDHNKLINHLHGLDKSDPFTFTVDQDIFKHSTTNVAGDLLKGNGTRFSRWAKGTANQIIQVNDAGTDLEWIDFPVIEGGWDPTAVEAIENKTINVDDNTLTADSIALSDILVSNGTKFIRKAKGTANQILRIAANGNDIEWGTPLTGGMFGGSISFNGNASTKIFVIPHGLTLGTPNLYFANPKTTDTLGDYTYSADATNITVTYSAAPPTGTNNVSFVWGAGYAGQADLSFTPSTINVLTNKSISGATNTFSAIPMTTLAGGHLIFDKIAVPANQADAEDILLYDKELDASNNSLTVKQQIGDAIVEVSAF